MLIQTWKLLKSNSILHNSYMQMQISYMDHVTLCTDGQTFVHCISNHAGEHDHHQVLFTSAPKGRETNKNSSFSVQLITWIVILEISDFWTPRYIIKWVWCLIWYYICSTCEVTDNVWDTVCLLSLLEDKGLFLNIIRTAQ